MKALRTKDRASYKKKARTGKKVRSSTKKFRSKTFTELTVQEKDELLKMLAVKFRLIKEEE